MDLNIKESCETSPGVCQIALLRAEAISKIEDEAEKVGKLVCRGTLHCSLGPIADDYAPDGFRCASGIEPPQISDTDLAEQARNMQLYGKASGPGEDRETI